MTDLKLYESEYRFMDLIWEAEPVRSTELAKMARERLEWKKTTCYTVLKKLEAKGFVKNEDATVTSLIGREQVQRAESSQLIERSFGGSLPAFLNAFLSGRRLTAEEARELHRLIEKAVPGDGASEEEHREEKGGSV